MAPGAVKEQGLMGRIRTPVERLAPPLHYAAASGFT